MKGLIPDDFQDGRFLLTKPDLGVGQKIWRPRSDSIMDTNIGKGFQSKDEKFEGPLSLDAIAIAVNSVSCL